LSEQTKLEKLQAMRAKLESESRSLIEEQEKLEKNVLALEEQVYVEELKKEKAVIEDLKNRNKAAKDAIAELKAKKKALQNKLNQVPEAQETLSSEEEKPKETEEVAEPIEVTPEEAEDGGVTVIAIEGGALVEDQELAEESPRQEKKKRRFF
jgi:chromosome segregation ATPase